MGIIRNHFAKKGYDENLNLRVKEYKKSLLLSSLIFLIFLISITFLLFSQNIWKVAGEVSKPYYNSVSNTYKDNPIVESLVTICNSFNLEEDKIKCVNNFFNYFYDYDYDRVNQITNKLLLTPDELINYGGICRDSAVFYSAVFESMGFTNEFIFEPEHVYNKICLENCYYLDQEYYEKI